MIGLFHLKLGEQPGCPCRSFFKRTEQVMSIFNNGFFKAVGLHFGSGCLILLMGLGFTACQSHASHITDEATRNRRPLPTLAASPTFELGRSVEQAYASIPHRRTVVDLNRSTVSSPDKEYLTLAF